MIFLRGRLFDAFLDGKKDSFLGHLRRPFLAKIGLSGLSKGLGKFSAIDLECRGAPGLPTGQHLAESWCKTCFF